ncbi:Uma2 family endonuclease [Mesorhizobium sp. LHD-90]|uniref:Uma2 family endonuclease n=1 Tax=Mesorhizobium sp. LHD-90 TaxID=3071414 RepID=UPI0027E00D93|nr:Uma2 family endonuclease [Mesorhizobium sp. LHD-90]MDQ6435204.1 Uma2 family endonuclease [Mesorhizobium sp. LHD-90]
MNTHIAPPPGKLTAEQFLEFIEDRPRGERWQLIDGVPFLMMSPAMLPHQRIGLNLIQRLNACLEIHRPDVVAMHEVAVRVESHPNTRLVTDVAVVDFEVENVVYCTRFFLAAEVLSDSNTREHISRKREIYADAPDCQYILILSQKDFAVEVWSRADGWKGHVYRSAGDLIDLPEFGFSCRLADLYRGVSMK